VIFLDALYRLYPPGVDENSNSAMAMVFNLIDGYADHTGSAFVIVHHASKGVQGGKSVVDVGSGASTQARACDSHLILRPHVEDGAIVLDAAVRSFAPVKPTCLRWIYPRWVPAQDLDPADLKIENPRRRPKTQDQPTPPTPEPWTVERFVLACFKPEPQEKKAIMAEAHNLDIPWRFAEDLLALAVARKLIHRWAFKKDRCVYFSTIPQPITAIEA
jgi:hypothetical protein